MIAMEHLTKSYGARVAIDDVSFDVVGGRLTGFVGGNGAGKTTCMRILMGVLAADRGTVSLDGRPLDAGTRHGFGYMPEERGLYPRMKVVEQLVYLATLHGWDAEAARRRTDDLVDRLGLRPYAEQNVETLSLGNQQKAQVAAALVHDPQVLVLDEPFSGLDPIAVDAVMEVLGEFAATGAPVLFSSHQLDVVERLCDDLVIIAAGRVRAAGPRERLRDQFSSPRWSLTATDTGWLRDVPGVDVEEFAADQAVFGADPQTAQRVLRAALDRGPVTGFGPVRPSLAEIFREVIAETRDDSTQVAA